MARGEWRSTTDLVTAAIAILDAESPMTIRQLFYRLVSAGSIENDRSSYQRVSRMMTTARDDGRCDPTYIVDRSRPEYSPSVWEDSSAYAEVIKSSYRKDYWATQPNHVEIWVEKDAIIGSIEGVTNELGVTIHVWRGFASTTKTHEIAQRFAKIKKPIVVFYLGDHDPSGRVIESDVRSRVQRYRIPPRYLPPAQKGNHHRSRQTRKRRESQGHIAARNGPRSGAAGLARRVLGDAQLRILGTDRTIAPPEGTDQNYQLRARFYERKNPPQISSVQGNHGKIQSRRLMAEMKEGLAFFGPTSENGIMARKMLASFAALRSLGKVVARKEAGQADQRIGGRRHGINKHGSVKRAGDSPLP
jgi:hypothetical protein